MPIRLPDAPPEIATPPPKIFPRESVTGWVPLCTATRPGDVSPDEVARDGVAIRALAGDPDPGEQIAAEQVPLGRVVDAVAVGPDEVVAGTRVDLDAVIVGLGLRAGRIGAQEVAVDPVAGRAGPGDVDAGALAEIVDVQAADGDVRRR